MLVTRFLFLLLLPYNRGYVFVTCGPGAQPARNNIEDIKCK